MANILKVGMQVMYRMLGELKRGVIINQREDGNFDVKCQTGTIIPNINWHDPQQKRKPWYIVQAGKTNRDPKVVSEDERELKEAFEEQKRFTRGEIKK